jgi:hypothetical protein
MKAAVTERAELGRSGLKVSRLAFGTGYRDEPVGAGARLLVEAYDRGVNFWDTSDDYGTHLHVGRALRVAFPSRSPHRAIRGRATAALGRLRLGLDPGPGGQRVLRPAIRCPPARAP